MNSLYGRFGMSYQLSKTRVMSNAEFDNLMSGLGFKHLKKINQIQPLGDKHKLISILNDNHETMLSSLGESH